MAKIWQWKAKSVYRKKAEDMAAVLEEELNTLEMEDYEIYDIFPAKDILGALFVIIARRLRPRQNPV